MSIHRFTVLHRMQYSSSSRERLRSSIRLTKSLLYHLSIVNCQFNFTTISDNLSFKIVEKDGDLARAPSFPFSSSSSSSYLYCLLSFVSSFSLGRFSFFFGPFLLSSQSPPQPPSQEPGGIPGHKQEGLELFKEPPTTTSR